MYSGQLKYHRDSAEEGYDTKEKNMRSNITRDYHQTGLAVFDYVQLKSALMVEEPVIIIAEFMVLNRCLEIQYMTQGPDLTKERAAL